MGRKGDGSLIKSISYPVALGTEKIKDLDDKTFMESLEALAKKENKSLSELTVELWKDYWKKHGNGNPNFTMTQWCNDPTLKAMPAFGNDLEFWKQYIEGLGQQNVELSDIEAKSRMILDLAVKMQRHGTTNVRYF